MPAYLTAEKVAEMLDTSLVTAIRVMERAGAINVGHGAKNRMLRITEASLNEYLETKQVAPPVPLPRPAHYEKKRPKNVLSYAEMYPGLQRRKA